MPERADAHIHLFEGAYRGSFSARPGVQLDEAACFASLAATHGVGAALVVGYAGAPWCAQNSAFLARLVARHEWVYPTAFAPAGDLPTIAQLEDLRAQGFVGLSFYVFEPAHLEPLRGAADAVWAWLVEHRWLLSVNSRGSNWRVWAEILERHGDLRVLVSHLGLPPRVSGPPPAAEARSALADVCHLARFPGPCVKLSGFYALTDPPHDYPHVAAWPYVEALLEAFGPGRLVWASDFSPCLEWVTYPQTLGLLAKMPFLGDADRRLIEGANLHALLDAARPHAEHAGRSAPPPARPRGSPSAAPPRD